MISLVLRVIISCTDVYADVRGRLERFSASVGVGERGRGAWGWEELGARGGDEGSDARVGKDRSEEGLLGAEVDGFLTLDTASFSVVSSLSLSCCMTRSKNDVRIFEFFVEIVSEVELGGSEGYQLEITSELA